MFEVKMREMILTASFIGAVFLCGCGHNVGTAFYGKVFNVGYDPELNKVGIQYYDGAMVTGLQKEKSKTTFKFEDTVEGKDGVKTVSSLDYSAENGDQITGYRVELEEAKQSRN